MCDTMHLPLSPAQLPAEMLLLPPPFISAELDRYVHVFGQDVAEHV